jgi:glutathionylspermidine synthase
MVPGTSVAAADAMRRIAMRERSDWRATAERCGFRFHTIDGERYWDETACYAFTLAQIEDDIEAPTAELHAMALDLVADVIASEGLMRRLAIPEPFRDWIADSWRAREPHLYGRMDFSYDGNGPAKLLELNYDTPTALYEAAFFQWVWLEEQIARGALAQGVDQYNLIQENLIDAFATIARALPAPLYLSAANDSDEDQGTIAYLDDCARQAGLATRRIAIEDIGLAEDGRFTDLEDRPIEALFKLYPLEFMFGEAFGKALPGSRCQLIEPPWKAILSNKGILPLLWEKYPDHPNLLPSFFHDGGSLPRGWVRKPLLSREGANIALRLESGECLRTDGPYVDGPFVRQQFHPLPQFDGRHALVGSWMVGDRASGIGMRDDATPITRDSSHFVPHIIQ